MTDALDLFPLSFAQQRLWLLDQLYPGNTAYAIPLGLFLQGDLQPSALAAAVDDLVARHETLRTTFVLEGQEAVQAIHPRGSARLEMEDRGEHSPEAAQAQAVAALQALAGEAFDLARGPLLRARLLAFGPRQHALLLVLHHIIADGWSIGVLSAELAALYKGRVAGEDPQLPELAVQYADFSAWQRETLAGDHRAALVAYWRQTLGTPPGGPEPLALPTDFPRPERQGFRGGSVPVHIDPTPLARLGVLERQLGATRAMALVALWAAFLARHSGQQDVVVGVPVAGRLRPELEPLIGFFVNTLPLRIRVDGEAGLTHLLATARDAMLAALAHQELPFEQIVEVVDPPRELGRTPLFQTMLSFLNLPRAALPMAGLTVSALPFPGQGAKFDLTLTLGREEDGSLIGGLEYDADLYTAATATRLARRFEAWVARCLAQPDLPLGQQPLLDKAELAEVLAWGSGPQRTWASPAEAPGDSFPARFVAWARAHPDALAARFPDTPGQPAYTYGRLLAEVEALARVLAARGGAPGTRIALCLERGPGLLVGLLAVQLCGAAYVPLDPLFPPERLEWMVSDAAPVLTLTEAALVSALPPSAGVRLLLEEVAGLADGLTPRPSSLPAPGDIAYVLYTSGSTGRPKGVQIPHGALLNLLLSMAERPGFTPADRLLAITTVSFDISGLELYLPLLVGGSLILAGRATAQDPERLARCLESEAATVLQATPATWRMLLATGWAGRPGLSALCGGEALTGDLAEALLPRVGRLWNMYGPTETTIWSSCLEVLPGQPRPPVLPVGEAIANTWLYVVDSAGQALPPGVVGELAIGGAGVAVGYLNRPELNAARFLPDPFHPGGRLYLTGDLARWEAGGTLAFLGRSDHQVKIRGYRIELGDIEAALGSHPAVRQAVVTVLARPAGSPADLGGATLGATLVPQDGQLPDPADLRQWLGARLPDYMVPSAWQLVAELPLTPNGKVDRKALPPFDPAASPGSGQSTSVAGAGGDERPQGEAEARVAQVWQTVLGLPQVGRHGDFFALGGHSLAAVSALLALRRGDGNVPPATHPFLRLTLADLFTHPTPARLVAHLQGPGRAPAGQPPGIVHFGGPAGSSPHIVLVPGAGGDSAYLAPLARQLGDRYPVLGLVAPGLDGSPPAPSLTALAEAYHEHLRHGLGTGPFVLVAHSLGSFAAHALASRWQDEARPLLGVVVLDTVAPVLEGPPFTGDAPAATATLRRELAAAVTHLAGEDAARLLPGEEDDASTTDAWLAAAGEVLRHQGHDDLADRLLPMARVYETGHRYTYCPTHPISPPHCPVQGPGTGGRPRPSGQPRVAPLAGDPGLGLAGPHPGPADGGRSSRGPPDPGGPRPRHSPGPGGGIRHSGVSGMNTSPPSPAFPAFPTAPGESPRVSVIVLSYRQADYIGPCLRSLFADTYPNLDILISDDHSPDDTFAAIEAAVAAAGYGGGAGEGRVRTNSAPRNLGLVPHLNWAMSQAKGDIVVFCGGDDIFVPGRIAQLVHALETTGASVAYSNAWVMDETGQVAGLMLPPQHRPFDFSKMTRTGFSAVPGCTIAWRREVFDHFGPLPETLANEDDQIGFRGELLGGVAYVDAPLVYYRVHQKAISGWTGRRADRETALRALDKALGNYLTNLEAWTRCLDRFSDTVPDILPANQKPRALDRQAGRRALQRCQIEGAAVRHIMAEAAWLPRVRLILAHWSALREPRNRLLFGFIPLFSRTAAVALYKTLGRLFARRAHRPKDTSMPAIAPEGGMAFPLDQGAPGVAR